MNDNGYKTIGDMLDNMSGHGVYDVALIEEQFGRYGFTYDRATQMLSYANQTVLLRGATPKQIQRDMKRDPKGGIMDEEVAEDALLIDALAISDAVHYLLMPGIQPASGRFLGRGLAFRSNVDAIRAFEKTQD